MYPGIGVHGMFEIFDKLVAGFPGFVVEDL